MNLSAYVLRRVLYAIPIIIGVNLITFLLFFVLNSPDKMAIRNNPKNATKELLEKWKREHNYHLPLLWSPAEKGLDKVTQTIFVQKSAGLLLFRLGKSDRNNMDIGGEIFRRMGPSLVIMVPVFFLGIMTTISCALIVAYYRATYVDTWGLVLSVVMMSISALFYVIAGQFLLGKVLRLVPISGFEQGLSATRFVILPILIGVITGLGGGVRFYRTMFLEEMNRDYIRTARAKGLSERVVLFRHVLKNAMIPILTQVVVAIPFLFVGSFLLEVFFGIPGLGSFTIEAINSQDFAIVRAMVYIDSLLYIAGLIMTDISYTLVDPRIRLS
ncbi:MAG: ABC transporter permease [Planctomycetota bacterium]